MTADMEGADFDALSRRLGSGPGGAPEAMGDLLGKMLIALKLGKDGGYRGATRAERLEEMGFAPPDGIC